MLFYDSTYILVLFGFLLAALASYGVKGAFNKYDKMQSLRHLTGRDAARKILDENGLHDVRIESIGGDLTDHFDPSANVIRLSNSTYNSDSVAAIGVAAHEAGHAVQYAEQYKPIVIRNSILPAVNVCSAIAMPLFIIGLILGAVGLANLGILLYSAALVFQVITLPVEFNASRRAIKILDNSAILEEDELSGAKKVLTAAAMTYVAAVLASALQILRLVLLSNSRRRD